MQHQSPAPDTAGIREIGGLVGDIVRHRRDLGVTGALAMAASLLGMGIRRTRGYHHGEIRAMPPGELERCREAFRGHMRQRRAELVREAAAVGDYLAASGTPA